MFYFQINQKNSGGKYEMSLNCFEFAISAEEHICFSFRSEQKQVHTFNIEFPELF
jgi:hypothetical protein